MRTTILLLSLLFVVPAAFGQIIRPDTTSNWRKHLSIGVNFNQAAFSSNWKAGGINSVGLNALFIYRANYKKDRHSWDNLIDLAYGFVNNEGQGNRKTLDRIFLDTKYGYQINTNWDAFASLSFQSQFAKGYQYPDDNTAELISDIFAPAFITLALGFEYHPVDYFKVRLSPFAPRLTIVNDPERFVTTVGPEPYGVTPPDNTRFEWFALQVMAEFDKDIATNLNLKWRYVLFANYETLDLETIDHRLDVTLTARVNNFITTSLGGTLLYDFDQDSGLQVSQAFALGFAYTFQNYEPE
ncbi:MAG TPA: DUF3078 domain-containing protein [Cyclobacteriaceae bacterium]|nr:DUF3078 domain-containing protein [Cyclobacteriaceae bacterium]